MRFSAALGNMSKLYCSRLHENFLVYLFAKYLQIAHAAVQVLALLAEIEV